MCPVGPIISIHELPYFPKRFLHCTPEGYSKKCTVRPLAATKSLFSPQRTLRTAAECTEGFFHWLAGVNLSPNIRLFLINLHRFQPELFFILQDFGPDRFFYFSYKDGKIIGQRYMIRVVLRSQCFDRRRSTLQVEG